MKLARNETPATRNETTCLLCGAPLNVRRTGRPPLFCSPKHRVQYHRLRKRSGNAGIGATVAGDAAPDPLAPPTRSTDERIEALRDITDCLDDLNPPGRVAGLRSLAEQADDLSFVLDAIASSVWALDGLGEAAWALENLEEHRPTLQRLSKLDALADDLAMLARDLREARRHREDLHLAIDELEDHDDGLC